MSQTRTPDESELHPVAKSELICFRVKPEMKQRIEAAALRKGQSVTTFLLQTVERAVGRVEKMGPAKSVSHQGVPTFFRALCAEARRGGEWGYSRAGHELARHLGSELPYDLEPEEWQEELNELAALLQPDNPEDREREAVLAWFREHYPKCVELVPPRGRRKFVEGVYRAADDGIIGLDV